MLFNLIEGMLTYLFNTFIRLNSRILICIFSLTTFSLTASVNAAQQLKQVVLNENNIVLMNVKLNKKLIISSLDGYLNNDGLLIAIEPLFDSLKLQYKLYDNRVVVWKDEVAHELFFNTGKIEKDNESYFSGLWLNDGFYLFVDIETIAKIFNVSIDYNSYQLSTSIITKDYLFPKQKLEILEEKRILATSGIQRKKVVAVTPKITIADQYRFIYHTSRQA